MCVYTHVCINIIVYARICLYVWGRETEKRLCYCLRGHTCMYTQSMDWVGPI